MSRRRDARTPILGPVILITIGVLALLQNFGQLPASFWPTLWRLWPLLLVLVGVELLLGQARLPSAVSFLLALLIIVVTIAGIVYLAQNAPQEPGQTGRETSMQTDAQGATSATARLEFGAGDLIVGATGGANIMEGEFSELAARKVEVNYSASGGRGDLRINIAGEGLPFATGANRNRWSIRLNKTIPLDLRIEAGLSSNDLDLSELKLSGLRVEAGLSSTKLRLPTSGDYEARVSCGMSSTTIVIPEGVAARIRVQSGLSSVTIDEGRFPKSGDIYQSPNYAAAANRVNLTIDGGMASIVVQ